jgi:hypothetical protein
MSLEGARRRAQKGTAANRILRAYRLWHKIQGTKDRIALPAVKVSLLRNRNTELRSSTPSRWRNQLRQADRDCYRPQGLTREPSRRRYSASMVIKQTPSLRSVFGVGFSLPGTIGGSCLSSQSLRLEPLPILVKGLLCPCIFGRFRLSRLECFASFEFSAARWFSLKHLDLPRTDRLPPLRPSHLPTDRKRRLQTDCPSKQTLHHHRLLQP